ncbi:MAG TPA: VWA-like domain-containing protein, partial [Burkholderiales bacterium]|nr:VWA-like domain-containing protein [Burkholderiales bacterium]
PALQFLLAHEALHCALGHFARRAHRVKLRWDVACDHAVNLLLAADGFTAPAGALCNPRYAGLSAEEIYPLIELDTEERTLDLHVFDSAAPVTDAGPGALGPYLPDGSGASSRSQLCSEPPQNAPVGDALAIAWRGRFAVAAEMAMRGGRLGEHWRKLLEHVLEPQLPWRALLQRYVVSLAREDYSFQRPARREGVALLPRLASGEIELVAALDTSGSISDEQLREFVAELDALKSGVRATVILHACDRKLCAKGPWMSRAWEPLAFPRELSGGGGTDFRPIFDWVERERLRPDVLIYFTDAEGDFPPEQPRYPVIWLVKGKARVPWGERIQLN